MGTGYVRNDTSNNIADGNVINASDLDGEFDALQSAFNASTGHSHDGTTGEGPQITTAGLADDAVTGAKIDSTTTVTAASFVGPLTGNVAGNVTGAVTGNADTATALQTARTIAGQSFNGTANISIAPTDLTGVTANATELNLLDGVTATTAELNKLDGFTGTVADLNYAKDLNATGVTTAEFDKLDGLTASTTELNILDGVTATTAELNILDGYTGSTAELNILDGVTATTAELNFVDGVTSNIQTQLNAKGTVSNLADLSITASAAEINKLDGVTASTAELNFVDGVTSAIQTQIDAKGDASLSGDQTFSGDNTFTGTSKVQQTKEKMTISATAATGTINYDALTQAVLYYTTDASANWTVNVRGDGSNTLNSIMSIGEALTVVFLVTQGSTAYYNSAFQVDGSSVTPKYQGGSAPTEGTASGIDAYTYNIIKTADATFTVLASLVDFS
jgi:hypothetical protein